MRVSLPPRAGTPRACVGAVASGGDGWGGGVLLIAPRAHPSPLASREGGEDASLRVEHLGNEP
jgi:hypothetical protein